MGNKDSKILIVDDDEYLLDIYSVKFSEEGMEVDTAVGGEDALQKIKEGNYSVLLLDIVMPSLDGFEVLQKIEEEGLADDMSVIVLSNQGQPEDIKKAKKYNVDGYIVKANTVPSEVVKEVQKIST